MTQLQRHPVPRLARIWPLALAAMLFASCANEGEPSAEPSPPESTPVTTPGSEPYTPMAPDAALRRAVMALTGLRPSAAELEAVREDPERLAEVVATYVERPEFGETIMDMYAEILLLRSTELILPNVGLLEGQSRSSIKDALSEEPLRLIREVVMSDAPFTEIVTANWTVLDPVASQIWEGHNYNQEEGGTQRVDFVDARPSAGVISTGPFLVRHESNGANYHRGRASIISDVFLCEPFGGRDIPITGEVDLSDDAAVANALVENQQCVACHQAVDPLAQHFWPYRARVTTAQLIRGHEEGCEGDSLCYPVPMYRADLAEDPEAPVPWEVLGLREPNYWGAESSALDDLGAHMANDPRFASCAVQQFAAYLAQRSRESLDPELVARHHLAFVDSGYSAKALAQALVTDPWFLAQSKHDAADVSIPEVPGVQVVRPEQYERLIESLTGFRLVYEIPQQNVGVVRALRDDLVGFRAMAGGIDGFSVTQPVHTATPVKLLVFDMAAQEAAGYVVDRDLESAPEARRLLSLVEPSDTDEGVIREQLIALHERLYGALAAQGDEAIDELYTLWSALHASANQAEAWKGVITAMLQSPDVIFY